MPRWAPDTGSTRPSLTAAAPIPTQRQPNALLSSAARITGARTSRKTRSTQADWQAEAWAHYDQIGELRYAVDWLGAALSKCRLVAAKQADKGAPPAPLDETELATDALPAEVLQAFAGGVTGQSQLLQRLAVHLGVPGDSYLIGVDEVDEDAQANTGEQTWVVRSTEEVKFRGDEIVVDTGEEEKVYGQEALCIRVWNPHPRKQWEATSPVRAVLPVLREIAGLSAHIAATTDSRLAGAGLLVMPSEVTFTRVGVTEEEPVPDGEDPFATDLIDAMVTPLEDRGSAAAVVPLIARIPGEYVDKVQHLSFSTPFDAAVDELRDKAIRRLALGLNMPPEVLLGQADANAWSAWQIEEAGLKMHVEPLLMVICDALTTGYYRPALKQAGIEDPSMYCVWFDTTDLQLRPNKSAEAQALFDRFAIDFDSLRRASGFDDSDAPSAEELRAQILLKAAENGHLDAGMIEALAGHTPKLRAAIEGQAGDVPLGEAIDLPDPAPTGGAAGGGAATTAKQIPDDLGQSGARTTPTQPTTSPAGAAPSQPSMTAGGRPVPLIDRLPTSVLNLLAEVGETMGAQVVADVLTAMHQTTAQTAMDASSRVMADVDARRGRAEAAAAACDVLVLRALERAGNKRRSRSDAMALREVPEFETHLHLGVDVEDVERLLAGAWTLLPRAAASAGVDPADLARVLHAYTRELLITGVPHTYEALRAHLVFSVLGTADAVPV